MVARTTFLFPVLVFLLWSNVLDGQVLRNGDFENNSADTCEWNLYNAQFNSLMDDVWGISTPVGQEIDIQREPCSYEFVLNNDWFISLSNKFVANTWEYDAISMEISEPLVVGEEYEIRFWALASTLFNNESVAIEIGLSEDSLSVGEQIFRDYPPEDNWGVFTFSFTAPFAAQYLTAKVSIADNRNGWIFVDSFEFLGTTSTVEDDASHSLGVEVFPNPAVDHITLRAVDRIDSYSLYNVNGELVKNEASLHLKNTVIDISALPSGMYHLAIYIDAQPTWHRIRID